MLGTNSLKAALAAGVLLAGGTLVAINAGAGDRSVSNSRSEQGLLTLPTITAEQSVMAQFGQASPPAQPAAKTLISRAGTASSEKDTPVQWQRPETAEDAEPSWLAGGHSQLDAVEVHRQVLSRKLEFSFDATPLHEVTEWLTEQTGTQFYLNSTEIELGGLANVDALIGAIENSVAPLDWDANGGQSTLTIVGSMMLYGETGK